MDWGARTEYLPTETARDGPPEAWPPAEVLAVPGVRSRSPRMITSVWIAVRPPKTMLDVPWI
jgi:hypothetical protein